MNTFVHFQYYLICFSSFTPHWAIRRLCIKHTSANTHRLNPESYSQGLSEVPISLIPTFSNLTIFQQFQFNVIFYVTPSPIRANTTLLFNQFLSHVEQVNCMISCVCALALSVDCKFLMVFPHYLSNPSPLPMSAQSQLHHLAYIYYFSFLFGLSTPFWPLPNCSRLCSQREALHTGV